MSRSGVSEEGLLALARQVILGESRALEALASQLDAAFPQAAHLLAGCQGHVIASGVGTTGMIARRLAHLLCNVGCPSLFLHAGDALHGSSGAVRQSDVLVLLSKSGETTETCQLAQIVQARGIPILALTARPDSALGRLSSLILKVATEDELDPYGGLMSVGSTLAMVAMCDALVFAVLQLKGTPAQDFIRGHPGGVVQRR